MRVIGIIIGALVFLFVVIPGLFVGGAAITVNNVLKDLDRTDKAMKASVQLSDKEIHDLTTLTSTERTSIIKTCRAAFAPDKALDDVVADIAQHGAKKEPFCACVLEGAADTTGYDRRVLVAYLQGDKVAQSQLRNGLTASGLTSHSAASRSSLAHNRVDANIERCMADNELK